MAEVDLKHLCGKCADAYRCKDKKPHGELVTFCNKYSPKGGLK